MFHIVDRDNWNKTVAHGLVSVRHICGAHMGNHTSPQVWQIRVCVYLHGQTSAHFIASRDLGCIQKHSGVCESPTVFNRVQMRPGGSIKIWRRAFQGMMGECRETHRAFSVRTAELKGSCSFQLQDAKQRQAVQPRLSLMPSTSELLTLTTPSLCVFDLREGEVRSF